MHLKPERITADLDDETIAALRARFWRNDDILLWLKKHGVNSNWDMVHAHIVVTLWLMLEQYVADHGCLDGCLKKVDASSTWVPSCGAIPCRRQTTYTAAWTMSFPNGPARTRSLLI